MFFDTHAHYDSHKFDSDRMEMLASMPEKGKTAEGFQFMRQGYFCLDNRDATPEHLVFNRSVALKDSFKA